jgi:hypothetical protein
VHVQYFISRRTSQKQGYVIEYKKLDVKYMLQDITNFNSTSHEKNNFRSRHLNYNISEDI